MNDTSIKQPKGIKWSHPAFLIATWFGIGKIPFAPGTMGSLAAFPLFMFSHFLLCLAKSESKFYYVYIAFLVVLFVVGQWASNVYMRKTGKEDPGEVVIDEVVGQLIVWFAAFAAFSPFLGIYDILYGSASEHSQTASLESLLELTSVPAIVAGYVAVLIPSYIVGFILFRIFDIWKPFPIRWCDKNIKGGFGVMFDDVFAAVYACIALNLIVMVFFVFFVHPVPPKTINENPATETEIVP
jgi:phosphatidylglycerophosphatase A